jgi:hypothetical protein
MRGLPNMQKYLKAEYRILSELASADSAIGFNELQEKSSVSSRTLAEHLKHFIPTMARKADGKYSITDTGRRRVENIERDLEMGTKRRNGHQYPAETVEVYSIGPEHFCKGRLTVTSPRKLLPKEREKMDKALTHTIGTFSSIVPKDSRNWKISVYSHNSS